MKSQCVSDVQTHTPHTHNILVSIHKQLSTYIHFIYALAFSQLILLVWINKYYIKQEMNAVYK